MPQFRPLRALEPWLSPESLSPGLDLHSMRGWAGAAPRVLPVLMFSDELPASQVLSEAGVSVRPVQVLPRTISRTTSPRSRRPPIGKWAVRAKTFGRHLHPRMSRVQSSPGFYSVPGHSQLFTAFCSSSEGSWWASGLTLIRNIKALTGCLPLAGQCAPCLCD